MQVPPHLRLFCPLANSALSVGSAGSSWQSWVRNIMEKWLTWWFQGDYRFRENNLVDGKERRIPPGMAGAEQELNSGIIGLPVFQQFCFSQWCRGSEGMRMERCLGLPGREGGWREVWDAPGLKVHRQTEVSPVLSAVPALFTSQVHLAPGFRGNCQDKREHSQLGLNEIFPKFSPEKVPHVCTTRSWLSWALVLAAEINHSGLCLAPLFAIQLVPFEIQITGIRILAGECRM